jgi:hypothetical protein
MLDASIHTHKYTCMHAWTMPDEHETCMNMHACMNTHMNVDSHMQMVDGISHFANHLGCILLAESTVVDYFIKQLTALVHDTCVKSRDTLMV